MAFIDVPTFRDGWFKRIKRWLLAEPILSVVVEWGEWSWVLCYKYRNGNVEIMKAGKSKPGDLIAVPGNIRIVFE